MEFPFLELSFAFVFLFPQKHNAMSQNFQWSHWKCKLNKLYKNKLVLGLQPHLMCFLMLHRPIPLATPQSVDDSSQLLREWVGGVGVSLERQWAPYPAGSQSRMWLMRGCQDRARAWGSSREQPMRDLAGRASSYIGDLVELPQERGKVWGS